MGANMARRLKEVGYPVTAVYDVNTQRRAGTRHGTRRGSLHEARARHRAERRRHHRRHRRQGAARHLHEQEGQPAHGRERPHVFVNCATISPATHVQVEKLAKKAKAASLEGCMASSITQARDGTLYLMCGGEKATFEKVKPILTKLSDEGKLLRYIGKAGQAAQVKALVNMVMNINTAGLAEGLGLADALGLDLKT